LNRTQSVSYENVCSTISARQLRRPGHVAQRSLQSSRLSTPSISGSHLSSGPGQIASPIHGLLADQVNASVLQQGKYAAKSISRKMIGQPPSPPFRYFDKVNLAVVGEKFAVLQSAGVQLSVFLRCLWTYLSGERGARLIVRQRSGS
jgi:hypothetical protein